MQLVKIKSIKKIENKSKRYDIEVENNHNFFANGILVHNCQSCISFLEEIQGKPCYLSIKDDGSSLSSLYISDTFTVCTRNHSIEEMDDNKFWQAVKKYDLKRILASFKNYAIQGELVGPGIQKNKLGLTEIDLHIFNIIDLSTRQRIPIHDALRFCEKYNLKHVDIVEMIPSFGYNLQDLIKLTFRKYPNTNNQIEGLVLRTQEYCYSKRLKGDSSCKIVNPEYRL